MPRAGVTLSCVLMPRFLWHISQFSEIRAQYYYDHVAQRLHELFLFLTPRLASALRWLRGRDGLGQSASMHLPSTPPLYGCDLTLHWRDLPTCVCSHRILIAARRRGCAKAEGLWPASRISIVYRVRVRSLFPSTRARVEDGAVSTRTQYWRPALWPRSRCTAPSPAFRVLPPSTSCLACAAGVTPTGWPPPSARRGSGQATDLRNPHTLPSGRHTHYRADAF